MITAKVIDISFATSGEDILDGLAESLAFPEWWGRNWDALFDCLSDPELSDIPAELHIRGISALEDKLPTDTNKLVEVLADVNRDRSDVSVFWE